MREQVGFVGLGKMGMPMARNLLKRGFRVVACDVSAEAVDELCLDGAQAASSPREVAQRSSIVITMLPSGSEVRSVALGEEGLIVGFRSGSLYIDMSTVDPDTSRLVCARLAQAGVGMLDAPVSRGQEAAIRGSLSIMVGGDSECLERARSVLEAMGTDIFHCGPIGTGALFKLVNNAIVAMTSCVVSEALVMSVKAGADLRKLLPVLQASSSNSFVVEQFFMKKALIGDFEPGGSIDTVAKDLELAMGVALACQAPMPLSAASYQLFATLRGQGFGGRDFSSVITLAEDAAGVQARME